MEEALDLFKLPLHLGVFEDKEVSVALGRFGPYVKWGEQFISLAKGEEPLSVDMDRALELIAEKQRADAPVGHFEGKPVTRGKGRFGPFIKWEDYYVNVPRKYDFDNLSEQDIFDLISAKVEKERNKMIHQWPAEKIAIENGRWGPFIRFGKLMLKLPMRPDGQKFTSDDAHELTLDDVKKMIEDQMPGAFDKKKSAKAEGPSPIPPGARAAKKVVAKKSPSAKSTTKKSTATKSVVKKSAPRKKS